MMKKNIKKNYLFLIILLTFLIVYNFTLSNSYNHTDYLLFDNTKIKSDKSQDYYKENFIRNENYIYKDNIKTVLIHKEGWQMSTPLIRLNTNDKIKISFDDLDSDVKDYKYTIVHCDANWKTSNIQQSKYIDGFMINDIENYEYSFNTTTDFTHYETLFPSDYTKASISGNYIFRVFIDENIDENVVFTSRFMIVDQKVRIEANRRRASSITDMNYKQEIDFTVYKNGFEISNPYRELRVTIQQNNRWDNIISELKPKMVKGNEINYDYDKENVFDGGNEYRNFDIKDLRYQSEEIKKIDYFDNANQVYLHTDQRRPYKVYVSDKDINGNKLIKTSERINSEIEADYTFVHFLIPYPAPLIDGELYILGALSNWQFTNKNRMKYDYQKKAYKASLLLKQGYYNYLYAFVKNGKTKADLSLIEGNHYETENEYKIYIYYREPGTQYDQLISFFHLTSNK